VLHNLVVHSHIGEGIAKMLRLVQKQKTW